MNKPVGFLIDLDGVLYIENAVIPGAIEVVNGLRRQGYPFRFLTNTTMKSAETLVKKLNGFGIEANRGEMFSTSVVAARWLAAEGISKIQLLVTEDAQKDFLDFQITAERPQAVVMGDMGRQYNYDVLNDAFVSIKAGARLVALQKNRFWRTQVGLAMDAGAWVAALEYAAEVEAELIGKPNQAYFETALGDLGLPTHQVAMIGDDVHTDILGARAVGAKTILVKTGKYVFDRDKHEEVQPDWILDSIADLGSILRA